MSHAFDLTKTKCVTIIVKASVALNSVDVTTDGRPIKCTADSNSTLPSKTMQGIIAGLKSLNSRITGKLLHVTVLTDLEYLRNFINDSAKLKLWRLEGCPAKNADLWKIILDLTDGMKLSSATLPLKPSKNKWKLGQSVVHGRTSKYTTIPVGPSTDVKADSDVDKEDDDDPSPWE
jgi:hypothetical protein